MSAAANVAPEAILGELAKLWVDLAKEDGAETSTGVLRAVTMTLIVLAEQSDDAAAIGATLAELMPEHPARAIVIRVHPGAERSMESRVFAQCWTPFGQRRHICSEQVEIATSEAALSEVPAVVLPLAVPDLPVMLWCRSASLMENPSFPGLAALAGKVIVDSAAFPDAAAILRRLQAAVKTGMIAGDLSWTRLTPWRELIARVFENRAWLESLPRVSAVGVTGGTPVSRLYLAAWLSAGVRAAGGKPAVRMDAGPEPRIDLDAGEMRMSVCRPQGQCAEVRINQMMSRSPLRAATDCELLREELGIVGRDPVFEKTLAEAVALAGS